MRRERCSSRYILTARRTATQRASKCQLHPKLNLPVLRRCRSDQTRSISSGSIGIKYGSVWLHEVGAIEQVEKLSPELQIHPLPPGQGRILDQTQVYVKYPRPDQCISRQIAVSPSQRKRERAGIKVAVRSSQR